VYNKFIALALTLLLCVPCALAAPLQGGVEETGTIEEPRQQEIMDMPTPVLPEVPMEKQKGSLEDTALKGNVKDDRLNGQVEDEGTDDMSAGVPEGDNVNKPVLRGKASLGGEGMEGDDPDSDDAELQVAWDKWRNKFLWAVQSGVQEALNNPEDINLRWDPQKQAVVMRFPLGTTAWFACKVANNRHVESVKLMHESGFPGYDKAVLDAVRNLEGTSILQFPKRSRRPFVTQAAGIKTSDQGGNQFFRFGDVERYRTGN
jgi:hypothetical protein